MDAEFLAQTFRLEQGWKETGTWTALERAAREWLIPAEDAGPLLESFKELRRVEGILRRWSYEGETTLPDDPAALYRVAVRCGWPAAEPFMTALAKWRSTIREVYEKLMVKRETD